MKEKYVEERFPRYFIFGRSLSGNVDIASTHNDTVASVSVEHAEALIKDRDKVIDMLCKMADAFDKANPKAFSDFWYGAIE